MTGVDDLVTWLRAQLDARERELDEDERVAREARPGPWMAKPVVYGPPEEGWGEPDNYEVWSSDGHPVVEHMHHEGGGTDEVNAEHIVRWDPDRVLARVATERAEVDATRRILDAYTHAVHMHRVMSETDDDGKWDWLFKEEALERVVGLLALPYAERDGYREDWRPQP